MAWRGAMRTNFFLKVTSGGITEEKVTPLMLFYRENLKVLCLCIP
jgi:hypothetical protein